jgi:cytochrome c-type biogenesis protein CcmH/NrfG
MGCEASERLYSKACLLLDGQRIGDALRVLRGAIKKHPDHGRLWALLGVAQWGVGAVTDSIASLETALTLVPLGADGRLALALGYEVIQKRDLATSLFCGLSEEEGLPDGVLEPLARALGRAGQFGRALRICHEASQRSPAEPGPLRGVAHYLEMLGRPPEEVIAVLFRALHLDPDNFDTRLRLAERLCDVRQPREAAYLLADLPIELSRCSRCLRRMRQVFVSAGDGENATRCVLALAAIGAAIDQRPRHRASG